MDYRLIDNKENNQYEIHVNGFIPKIQYRKSGNKIFLTHTEVPADLAGKGIGSSLVKMVLEDIKQKELKLVPICPFVSAYVKRHAEWSNLIPKE
ncbi:MAG TPA: GNAT family N-acetyltransferase [Draconibacterium sp.]|mgnify:CR=1 FL=1|nr:GNAT family N-acetyltransferase [Draconibacterium sp.]